MGNKLIYSAEYKASLLAKFHQSNMSERAFALSEGVKLTTFCYWLRKEAEYALAINAKPENQANLIDVTGQVKKLNEADTIKLKVNGFKIELRREDLGSLIGALRDHD